MQAQFIVIEGLEGAGKSTAMNWVKTLLARAGIENILTTREPGGTPIAEQLRHLLKDHAGDEPIYAESELLLMYASRVQLVNYVIKPALAAGQWVIGDRHELSTRAYQGGGRQIDMSKIAAIHDACLGDFGADFTLYLDIDPAVGLQRANQRGVLDRIEQEDLSFFQRTRQHYLDVAADDDTVVTIDAMRSIDAVRDAIAQALSQRYSHLPFAGV